MALKLEFNIVGGDFNLAGKASSKIKKKLVQLNIDPKMIKRIVVATYEAELNVVAHAYSGILNACFDPLFFTATVTDKGPGIEDIDKAMEAGFSTASGIVREMGFGAGMGLPNIKKNTDELKIESVVGKGTTLFFKIYY
ncbi:MAG: anti-sigma regulatory factor serine/threonine protein [Prolixibacteraceae bacterium]|nr:MAG: anti-sigma regulatory factor serine/threonine protein [Prolixibacteraceae bacterium]